MFLAAAVAGAALFLVTAPASAQVSVLVNGNAVQFAAAPIVQDGRVFVPLRGVFEQLGATVDYNNGTITATSGNGQAIALRIGSTQATVNGQPQLVDVAPFIVGDTTFVPLRFVSESLGATVNWDEASETVSIGLAGAHSDGALQSSSDDGSFADNAPPPLPSYDQPPAPVADDMWQPGYWSSGSYGYYYVPGTWVAPPHPGYYWTPGYWSYDRNRYAWRRGYWATTVGFYGGINYGAGYFGHGYNGGRWDHDRFQYNTYVTHVNTTIIKNIYVDRSVTIDQPGHARFRIREL